MKRCVWWCLFPGEVYGSDFRFREPVSEKEARSYIRDWAKVKRLPRGTQIWAGQE